MLYIALRKDRLPAKECVLAKAQRSSKKGSKRAGKRSAAGQQSEGDPATGASAASGGAAIAAPGAKLMLFGAFLVAGLILYGPALSGSFISDDEHYVQRNVYVHDPLDNIVAILDPTSVLAVVVENYAPVHVLLHALEWQLFETDVFGYHVVNVIFHALASLLLVLVFVRSGISPLAAALGGAFFLVHPANVEAVAWINQLKTSSAMAMCLGALLAHPHRPKTAAVLFGLALLAKPPAAVALFVAAAFGWARTRANRSAGDEAPTADDWRWRWLIGWAAILVVFAIAEFAAFGQTAGRAPPLYEDLPTRFRTIFAIALRYVVMALSSSGLSAFHEPPPATSMLDPWWLCSLVVFGALAWRSVLALRDRREEAAYWIFAVVSFGPVSGFIPLPFPMADRYLYFMLPGLIGGCLLAGPPLLERLSSSVGGWGKRGWKALHVVAALWIVAFAVRSFERAYVWRSPFTVMADVERNYPEGTAAKTNRATRAAQSGDAETAVMLLREAHKRGYNRLDHLLMPSYAAIQGAAPFVALKREWAQEWIDRLTANDTPSQLELQLIAQARIVMGDLVGARREVQRAIEMGGPITDSLYQDLEALDYELRMSRLRRTAVP